MKICEVSSREVLRDRYEPKLNSPGKFQCRLLHIKFHLNSSGIGCERSEQEENFPLRVHFVQGTREKAVNIESYLH